MFSALFEYQFLQYAFIVIVLSSIVCGIAGNLIIEKKMLMISGGLAHTAYGGIGLAYFLEFDPMLGAFFFSLCSALFIAFLYKKSHVSHDIFIALFWALGMALGVIFIGPKNYIPYLIIKDGGPSRTRTADQSVMSRPL